jgi:LysM repeat protein
MEYYENGGGAVAQFRWEQTTIACSNQYRADYFNNRSLSGSPTYTRCENWPINWDWGNGGPGNGIGNDNFSVRWTGQASINAGTYTFIARADDGVRVWLDDSLIIDQWHDQGATEYRVTRTVNSGNHNIKMEYYENGGGAVAQFRWEQTSTSNTYNRLVAKHSNRCMDVAGGSRDNGAWIIQWDCHGGDNQAWNLVQVGDYYKLVAKHSGKCADVYGVSRDNGARLVQWDCNGGDNQLFRKESMGGSFYRLRAKHSNKCIDVYGALRDNGASLIQWDCHGGDNQSWSVQSVGAAALFSSSKNVFHEYVLPIAPSHTTTLIKHKVYKGDSLASIAKVYQISIKAILKVNPGLKIGAIKAGQILNIPVTVCPKLQKGIVRPTDSPPDDTVTDQSSCAP